MKILLIICLTGFLIGCESVEDKAARYCLDKGGVKGYSVRWGFNIVHCNDGNRVMADDL